ncbi:MAG: OmpA family protein [Candidatus Thiodiazotropha sp.]
MPITINTRLLRHACTALLLVAGSTTALAESRTPVPGYVMDYDGNIVRSGYGECLHTGYWKPEMATVTGCDGYELNKAVKIIEGDAKEEISTILFPQAELFAFDSDKLSDSGKDYIRNYREELGDVLAQAYAVVILGHTDSTGDDAYNLELSKRRAAAVADYLTTLNVPADKMKIIGRGESDPLVPNDTEEHRAQNRRVEVFVVGQPRALDAMVFPSVALFERRSGELTGEGKNLLEQSITQAMDTLTKAVFIGILGHTDDVGDDDYNQDLSEQRARAVRDYLVGGGVDPNKIATWGAGEKEPIASNTTPEGRAENRRVEVLVLGRIKK